MTDFSALRERFSPLSEVWIAQSRRTSREWIYLGELSAVDGRNRENRQSGTLRRIPVQPRSPAELRDWIKSGPDELDRTLEGDMPEDLGWSIKIEEHYPELPEGKR